MYIWTYLYKYTVSKCLYHQFSTYLPFNFQILNQIIDYIPWINVQTHIQPLFFSNLFVWSFFDQALKVYPSWKFPLITVLKIIPRKLMCFCICLLLSFVCIAFKFNGASMFLLFLFVHWLVSVVGYLSSLLTTWCTPEDYWWMPGRKRHQIRNENHRHLDNFFVLPTYVFTICLVLIIFIHLWFDMDFYCSNQTLWLYNLDNTQLMMGI